MEGRTTSMRCAALGQSTISTSTSGRVCETANCKDWLLGSRAEAWLRSWGVWRPRPDWCPQYTHVSADRPTEPVRISSNWAVATWCGVSVVSYQVCQYYRSKEKAGIKQAQDLMEKKRASIEAKKEARRRAREDHDMAEQARKLEGERKKTWGYWYQQNLKFW
jgi:hypothetical protein